LLNAGKELAMYYICLTRSGEPTEYVASKLNPYAADKEYRQLLLREDLQNTSSRVTLLLENEELKSHKFEPAPVAVHSTHNQQWVPVA